MTARPLFDSDNPASRPSSHELHLRLRHARGSYVHKLVLALVRQARGWLQPLAMRGARMAIRFAKEWYCRRAIRALHRFDDRLLADMGISRADIEMVVRHGRADHSLP